MRLEWKQSLVYIFTKNNNVDRGVQAIKYKKRILEIILHIIQGVTQGVTHSKSR